MSSTSLEVVCQWGKPHDRDSLQHLPEPHYIVRQLCGNANTSSFLGQEGAGVLKFGPVSVGILTNLLQLLQFFTCKVDIFLYIPESNEVKAGLCF
jgi:hypothetical protein